MSALKIENEKILNISYSICNKQQQKQRNKADDD